MGRTPRTASIALALLLCAVPVACGDDDTPSSTGTTIVVTTADIGTPTTAGNGGSAVTTAPADTTTTAATGTVIEVTVSGDDVQGGGRKQVKKDEPVTIRVTSDEADEIHVHGYDLKAELEAGVPGEITFTPNAAGVFEVELEEQGLQLLELEVR
jgi:hypothetical protein